MPPPPIDTTALLRAYHDEHQRAVERILASCGVPAADRPDVAQEVFLAAHHELRRSASPIERPGPWLARVAIRRASNYRRGQGSLRLVSLDEAQAAQLVHTLESPEQRLGNCQLLAVLLDEIDEQARAIVLAHLAEGRTWEEIAEEQNLSIDRAKYLHGKALAAMEAALARGGSPRIALERSCFPSPWSRSSTRRARKRTRGSRPQSSSGDGRRWREGSTRSTSCPPDRPRCSGPRSPSSSAAPPACALSRRAGSSLAGLVGLTRVAAWRRA